MKKNITKLIIILFTIFISTNYIQSKNLPKKKPSVHNSQKKKNKKKTLTENEKLEKKIKKINLKKKLIESKNNLLKQKQKAMLSKMKFNKEFISLQNELYIEKLKRDNLPFLKEKQKMNVELIKLKLKKLKMNMKLIGSAYFLNQVQIDVAKRKINKKWNEEVNAKIIYHANPYKNGILTISDRRIKMNGVITYSLSNKIVEKINFFNNKNSKYPIFIIIDANFGGSVMAGYKIMQAIKTSKAPVYVVVKSFAASMAAIILTMADRSFAYPNAVILHHQLSSVSWGNITQQKEAVKIAEEWSKRILDPVAKKMNLTIKEFIKKMYKHNSDGDWQEFGDKAHKLKWVNNIVNEIHEQAYRVPKKKKRRFFLFGQKEEKDTNGKRFVQLPRLYPYDFYFLFNPDNYYK